MDCNESNIVSISCELMEIEIIQIENRDFMGMGIHWGLHMSEAWFLIFEFNLAMSSDHARQQLKIQANHVVYVFFFNNICIHDV